jgi:hypothetical protein
LNAGTFLRPVYRLEEVTINRSRSFSLRLAIALIVAGCGGAGPVVSPASPNVAVSPPAASVEGRWVSAVTPIGEIRAAMIGAGISEADADAWIAEVGFPTTYRFELEFRGDSLFHRQQVNGGMMEEDESGRFELERDRLTLTVGEGTAADTYTFTVTLDEHVLRLRWLGANDSGSTEDKEHHRRYTIAFFCSTPFTRV